MSEQGIVGPIDRPLPPQRGAAGTHTHLSHLASANETDTRRHSGVGGDLRPNRPAGQQRGKAAAAEIACAGATRESVVALALPLSLSLSLLPISSLFSEAECLGERVTTLSAIYRCWSLLRCCLLCRRRQSPPSRPLSWLAAAAPHRLRLTAPCMRCVDCSAPRAWPPAAALAAVFALQGSVERGADA